LKFFLGWAGPGPCILGLGWTCPTQWTVEQLSTTQNSGATGEWRRRRRKGRGGGLTCGAAGGGGEEADDGSQWLLRWRAVFLQFFSSSSLCRGTSLCFSPPSSSASVCTSLFFFLSFVLSLSFWSLVSLSSFLLFFLFSFSMFCFVSLLSSFKNNLLLNLSVSKHFSPSLQKLLHVKNVFSLHPLFVFIFFKIFLSSQNTLSSVRLSLYQKFPLFSPVFPHVILCFSFPSLSSSSFLFFSTLSLFSKPSVSHSLQRNFCPPVRSPPPGLSHPGAGGNGATLPLQGKVAGRLQGMVLLSFIYLVGRVCGSMGCVSFMQVGGDRERGRIARKEDLKNSFSFPCCTSRGRRTMPFQNDIVLWFFFWKKEMNLGVPQK